MHFLSLDLSNESIAAWFEALSWKPWQESNEGDQQRVGSASSIIPCRDLNDCLCSSVLTAASGRVKLFVPLRTQFTVATGNREQSWLNTNSIW